MVIKMVYNDFGLGLCPGAWSRPFGHFGRFSMPMRMPEFHVSLRIGFEEG